MNTLTLKYKQTLAAIRFLFRRRLSIDSNSIATNIKDYQFSINLQSSEQYNDVVGVKKGLKKSTKNGLKEGDKNNAIHPLYLTKISWHIIERLNEFLEVKLEPQLLKMLVHFSDYFEYLSELKLNTNYVVKSSLCLITPHKKGTKLTLKFKYYCKNELVVTEYTSGILFGVKCIGGERMFGELPRLKREKEQVIWSQTVPIDYQLPYQYADKAEIDAPIHTDPKFAKSLGLPDIILQGTCTFALSVSLILQTVLDELSGEFAINGKKLKSTSANFTGMLLVPNSITVRVLFKNHTKIFFDVLNQQSKAVIKGGSLIFEKLES